MAPALTLTDREYQIMRDLARSVMSAVGVETGGANVQFAVNPKDGRIIIIAKSGRPRYPGFLPYYVAKTGVVGLNSITFSGSAAVGNFGLAVLLAT